MKKYLFFVFVSSALAQENVDSLDLKEFTKREEASKSIILPQEAENNVIYAGKKASFILLNKQQSDLSLNISRQVFAKIPGVHVWESEGSGIQTSIAARGLSPNRSWEFNMRQNGYDISPDIFGYPESYYTPPLEAVEKIEVIKGAASLQFGPQFGGLVNYQLKKPDSLKKFAFEIIQTAGSYGLLNRYSAIHGTLGKFSYYAYLQNRQGDGWRKNSQYDIYNTFLFTKYQFHAKWFISAEYTKMNYKSRQAGGLTDQQFEDNAQLSYRERNWFESRWNVVSLKTSCKPNKKWSMNLNLFGLIAQRNSVGYLQAITVKDSINPSTLNYNSRQLDRDFYKNIGLEFRSTYGYTLLGKNHILAFGARGYLGSTLRQQQGTGSTGYDYDLVLYKPYQKSLSFGTQNNALFAENIFHVGKKVKIVPGVRIESVGSSKEGYIALNNGNIIPENTSRLILLYGLGTEYQIKNENKIYANYSKSYRPITFSELTPSATTEIVDPNLKDASGYQADFGLQGVIKKLLHYDISAFYLLYDNRIGSLAQNGTLLKTNIGQSVSQGIESYLELNLLHCCKKIGILNLYTSNSFIDAKYTHWNNPSIAQDPKKSIVGKRVENVPSQLHRAGLSYQYKGLNISAQYSYVDKVFTDASNTVAANKNGTVGEIKAYQVFDASISYLLLQRYALKLGSNNLLDERYATRRATGYPGPGLLPADARTFYITISTKF